MRPLKLTMQAFGAFPLKIEIPFEKLGSGNIYLISGVTGSGKTTIFDAICYALFNSPSGAIRGNQTLRSHFAKDNIESYVELEFIFNGDIYKILRHPSYERKKTRGEGYIQEQAQAQLTLPDGKIIEKVKEVDEYIVSLLGLNVTQFSQVALLAQGEFLKLLNADTQTRAEVFRNIFKTWNYANFQNKLKEKTVFYKNEYENIESSILQYINDVLPISEELTDIKEKYIKNKCFDNLDVLIFLLENQNKHDDEQLKKIKQEVELIEGKNINLQSEFTKIKTKMNLENQKSDSLNKLSVLMEKYEVLKKKNEKASLKQNILDKLMLLIKKNDDDCKKSIEIKKNNSDLICYRSDLNFANGKLFKLREDLKEIKINFVQTVFSEYFKSNELLQLKQKEFLEFQEKVKKMSIEYNDNYNEYLRQQAGIIAQTLIENEPCPVCGSRNHPDVAKIKNMQLTKQMLDELKEELEKNNVKLANFASDVSRINEQTKALNENKLNLEKRFNLKIKEECVEIRKINFEDEIINIENNIKKIEDEVILLSKLISASEAKNETLLKDVGNKNIEEIISYHKKLLNRHDYLCSIVNQIKNEFLSLELEKVNLDFQISLYDKQISEFSNIESKNIDAISNEIELYKAKLLELNSNLQNLLIRKTINEKVLKSIKIKNKEFINVSKLYSDYKILSDCANGNLKKCARIPFEQYIQGYYLDLVLYEANKHLKIMTQNQYQLIRKKDITSLQAKTGLDLEVMDFHTFKKRSTKTLSGGESFKAALALALGLSDTISNFSGAMNIDSMFIDEGFGSLDSESLELAMDVIFNLSNNNRLIGIISHIDDLKSKVQNQISAIKSENGSKIELNFN